MPFLDQKGKQYDCIIINLLYIKNSPMNVANVVVSRNVEVIVPFIIVYRVPNENDKTKCLKCYCFKYIFALSFLVLIWGRIIKRNLVNFNNMFKKGYFLLYFVYALVQICIKQCVNPIREINQARHRIYLCDHELRSFFKLHLIMTP